MPVKQTSVAIKFLQSKEFDLVVLGPPFQEKDKTSINHSNIYLINKPEDIKGLFDKYQTKPLPAEAPRKLKPLKADINYASAKGKVLLITTNKETVKELDCFELRVATNLYSAKRLILDNGFNLIIMDMGLKLKTNLPTYKWGIDVLNKKDVYLLLTTGRLSLETTES